MRVLSYNIRGGLGMDGRRSIARVADAILPLSPNIVCLQEVHQRLPESGFVDQPARLQKLLGMPVIFLRNLNFGIAGYGLAIATHFPVVQKKQHFLPSRGERRGALEVRLQTEIGPVAVFCTHWGLNAEERLRQAAFLSSRIHSLSVPVIVCGDFNERADGRAATALREQARLFDAGAAQNQPTYPSDAPQARIDFLLSSPSLGSASLQIVETTASDHLPLFADFGTS